MLATTVFLYFGCLCTTYVASKTDLLCQKVFFLAGYDLARHVAAAVAKADKV